MATIFYTILNQDVNENKYLSSFDLLPDEMKRKALAHRRPIDRLTSLFGKLLLLEGLRRLDLHTYSLQKIRYNTAQRPYFNSNIDFNISHSGNCIMCAVSSSFRVGLDVEKIHPILIDDFKNQLTDREWENVITSINPLYRFFNYWTRKEAAVKADGQGLGHPLASFDVTTKAVCLQGRNWYLEEVCIDPCYVAHLATDKLLPKNVELVNIEF